MQKPERPFWQTKTLEEMSETEWEALCDGCGRCCLHKLEDEDTQEVFYTTVACRLLDLHSCRCKHYSQRKRYVADCLMLSASALQQLHWLPETCAYRRLASGKSLPGWHPLITGSAQSVHNAQISIRNFAISEDDVEDLRHYVIPSL